MSRHLMLVPSLACPASCAYCFGPHKGGSPMTRATLDAVVRWQNALGDKDTLEITFHGGEPLVPGIQFYRMALPLLRDGLAPRRVRFAMQSNLWLLTDELCDLFREYGVSLGTSLDGPEPINDAQRGTGYFSRTMASIKRARVHGLDVGCICTFTSQSAPHAQEIFDFFVREGLGFSIHAALPTLSRSSAAQYCHSEARRAEESLSRKAETLRRLAAQGDTSLSDAWPLPPRLTANCSWICWIATWRTWTKYASARWTRCAAASRRGAAGFAPLAIAWVNIWPSRRMARFTLASVSSA
jgi:sulfatase maturation enzyme AslB (radical SAM superfamily)